jgi:hypothetical protein
VKRGLVVAVSGTVLVLTACSTSTTGSPTTTAPTAGGGSTSSAAAPTTAADPLANIDPCSLLTPAQKSSSGITSTKAFSDSESRNCNYTRPSGVDNNGFTFTVYLFGNSGYRDIDTTGLTITDHNVGSHPGILLRKPDTESCLINFQITANSHIELGAVTVDNNIDNACSVVTSGADKVSQNLPAGL